MKVSVPNQNIEIRLLMDAVYQKYGYDFRDYAKASLKRRILRRLELSGMESISAMIHRLLYNESFFYEILSDLSINVTEMFRDPGFYKALKSQVLPALARLPFIKIWHAGCATGEEVYSMAIWLSEAGLYEKTRIYATDFNQEVVDKAKEGIYPVGIMKEYTRNYLKSGGRLSFSDYYTAKYDYAAIKQFLKKNIVFAEHNLATDWVFAEVDLILCRNVLIYFNRDLQNRVFKLFYESLSHEGVLCLGTKESIRFSDYSDFFEDVSPKEKIYQLKP